MLKISGSSRRNPVIDARRFLLLFGAALTLLPLRSSEAGFPIITSYSSAEIGVDAISFSAIQDVDGTLLFGGNSLVTFDGERWTNTPIDGAYVLRSLDRGPDGKVWIAAIGEIGWFEKSADLRWKFNSLRDQLPESARQMSAVWCVFAEANGATFFSQDQILRWTGSHFDVWTMPNGRRLPASRVNGTIYVYYEHGGLYELGPLGPKIVISLDVLKDAAVLWMQARGSGWLLGTSKGLYLYRDHTLEPFAPEVSAILRRDVLTAAVQLPDGRIAFGTWRGGIVLMEPDGAVSGVLAEKDGLPTRTINSLLVDREGSLWATSDSGIFRVALHSTSTIFDGRASLPAVAYRGITRANGRVVLGSENGIYELIPETRQFSLSPFVQEHVHDMVSSSDGVIVGLRRGAKQLNANAERVLYSTQFDVFAIGSSQRSQAGLYLSDYRSIVLTAPGGGSRIIVQDLPDIARTIAEDDAGNLWVGTIARGVLFVRRDSEEPVEAVPVDQAAGLPELKGRSFVRATAEGSILVFAENGGWLKPAGSDRFQAIENHPARAVAAVSDVQPDGTCWVVHAPSQSLAMCAAQISVEQGKAQWRPHSVPDLSAVGFPRSIFVETAPDQSRVLWIGGTRSVLRHEIKQDILAPQPRPPILRAFARNAKNDQPAPITSALPYSTHSIRFEFATAEFSHRAALRLQTRLDGIDSDWVPASPDSRRQLTALRDASYTFRVRTVAETGVASEPAVFQFRILPPWWRTTPAIALGLLALVPLGAGLYQLRVRALRRRNEALEKKVQERTEQLATANAAKTQFVTNMSHDIRNPLNGIVGLALALEDTRLDRRQTEIVATLRECTTYLSTLVDDVLDFASIEAGRVELRPGPFVPQQLLRSIVETLKADTAEGGATLAISVDPDLPATLLGDAGRIQQILVNYVSNALKYAGGHIRLSASTVPNAPGEVEFAVSDEGAGVTEADQATLFTKFSRLKQTSGGENIPGTGLGLAACRLLADIMGGSVGVESAFGHGARFYLRLPLSVASAPPPVDTTHLPNTTVLLVEDTDYNAWAASAVLAKLGLSSERACTGAEALVLFAEKRFNVVLLDRNLPDMDGTEVARRMREMESDGRQAVLLAVTAYCTAEDRALCLASGMDAFVGKPLTPEKLRKVLLAAGRRMLAAASVDVRPEIPDVKLDLALLNYLSDGSEEGLETQVQRFVVSLEEEHAQLESAWQAHDFPRLAREAHRLHGQAKMVGGTALAEAAAQLESCALSEDRSACHESLRTVRAELRAVTAAMRHRRPTSLPR